MSLVGSATHVELTRSPSLLELSGYHVSVPRHPLTCYMHKHTNVVQRNQGEWRFTTRVARRLFTAGTSVGDN